MKHILFAAAILSLPLSAGTPLSSGVLDPSNPNDVAMTTVTLAATGFYRSAVVQLRRRNGSAGQYLCGRSDRVDLRRYRSECAVGRFQR
jgi:hypothetical protein